MIDCEAVVLDGGSNFTELQANLNSPRAVRYAFDLLFLDGEDLRAKLFEDRRAALGGIIPAAGAVVMSDEYVGAVTTDA